MLKRQQRVPPGQPLAGRGHVLPHAPHERLQRVDKTDQETTHFRDRYLALHHDEPHQVQSQVARDGLGLDRLPDPFQVHGSSRFGGLPDAPSPAAGRHRHLDAQQPAPLQAAQGRIQRARAGLVDRRGRGGEHLLQVVSGSRLVHEHAEQHLLEVGQRPFHHDWQPLFQWVE
jgi:hypothetical protein